MARCPAEENPVGPLESLREHVRRCEAPSSPTRPLSQCATLSSASGCPSSARGGLGSPLLCRGEGGISESRERRIYLDGSEGREAPQPLLCVTPRPGSNAHAATRTAFATYVVNTRPVTRPLRTKRFANRVLVSVLISVYLQCRGSSSHTHVDLNRPSWKRMRPHSVVSPGCYLRISRPSDSSTLALLLLDSSYFHGPVSWFSVLLQRGVVATRNVNRTGAASPPRLRPHTARRASGRPDAITWRR